MWGSLFAAIHCCRTDSNRYPVKAGKAGGILEVQQQVYQAHLHTMYLHNWLFLYADLKGFERNGWGKKHLVLSCLITLLFPIYMENNNPKPDVSSFGNIGKPYIICLKLCILSRRSIPLLKCIHTILTAPHLSHCDNKSPMWFIEILWDEIIKKAV